MGGREGELGLGFLDIKGGGGGGLESKKSLQILDVQGFA